MRRKIVLSLLGIAAAAVACQLLVAARRKVVPVEPGTVAEAIVARAVVVPTDGIAELWPRTDGSVVRVLVHTGDAVRIGTLLAELDGETLWSEVSRRDAERRAAEASARAVREGPRAEERQVADADQRAAREELRIAQARAERVDRLHKAGASSDADADSAQEVVTIAREALARASARVELMRGGRATEVLAAKAHAQAAQSALVQAQSEARYTRIVAPIDGVVVERNIDPGDTVVHGAAGASGRPAFAIADVSRIELQIEVADSDAARVAVGRAVRFTGEGGGATVGRGRIVRVGPLLQDRTMGLDDPRMRGDARARLAWAALDQQPQPPLVVGQHLEASIALGDRTVGGRLPRAAVGIRDGRAVVRVRWGPFVRERPVTLGVADDAFVEVTNIALGDEVLAGE